MRHFGDGVCEQHARSKRWEKVPDSEAEERLKAAIGQLGLPSTIVHEFRRSWSLDQAPHLTRNCTFEHTSIFSFSFGSFAIFMPRQRLDNSLAPVVCQRAMSPFGVAAPCDR